MVSKISHLLLLLCLATLGYGQADNAQVKFFIKNAGITVDGTFEEILVTYKFQPENLQASKFEVSIPTKTINTGNKARDKHLRKSKYFDVETYPNMTFISTRIEKTAEGYHLFGDLTIKKTKREVTIDFAIETSDGATSLVGNLALDRRDYGVGKNHLILSDLVSIEILLPYSAN